VRSLLRGFMLLSALQFEKYPRRCERRDQILW